MIPIIHLQRVRSEINEEFRRIRKMVLLQEMTVEEGKRALNKAVNDSIDTNFVPVRKVDCQLEEWEKLEKEQ